MFQGFRNFTVQIRGFRLYSSRRSAFSALGKLFFRELKGPTKHPRNRPFKFIWASKILSSRSTAPSARFASASHFFGIRYHAFSGCRTGSAAGSTPDLEQKIIAMSRHRKKRTLDSTGINIWMSLHPAEQARPLPKILRKAMDLCIQYDDEIHQNWLFLVVIPM